jgi:hypothetical protein
LSITPKLHETDNIEFPLGKYEGKKPLGNLMSWREDINIILQNSVIKKGKDIPVTGCEDP